MDNSNRDLDRTDAGQAIAGIGYQLRKGLDRVSFEADKLMRTNRIRTETVRLQKQASKIMGNISERVLELEAQGAEMEPSIQTMVNEVRALRKQLADKSAEIETINNEAWVEPPPPLAPGPAPSGSGTPSLSEGKPETPRKKTIIEGESSVVTPRTTCPSCKGPLRPESVFCPNCGYKL